MENPCKFHEDAARRLSATETKVETHDKQIDTIFESIESNKDIMHEVRIAIQGLNLQFATMQKTVCGDIKELGESFKQHNDNSTRLLCHYDAIVDEFRRKFAELDQFSWFRNWLNNVKDNLPKFVLYTVLGFVAVLVIYHSAESRFVSFVGKLLGK